MLTRTGTQLRAKQKMKKRKKQHALGDLINK